MPEINAVGDLVLTRAAEFRALADPLALSLTDRLRPARVVTTTDLAAQTGAAEADVEARLVELAQVGIVTREADGWTAVAKGFVFEIPDDAEGQAAARELTNVALLQYIDVPRRWVEDDESRLDVDWARAAGLFNARPVLTPDELRGVQEDLEELLKPYLTRAAENVPADARPVRILAYFLPDATASS